MNNFPPGGYVADAMSRLPSPTPDTRRQTVEVDAGPAWGKYRITFEVKRNPRAGMGRHWFWAMESGERISGPIRIGSS